MSLLRNVRALVLPRARSDLSHEYLMSARATCSHVMDGQWQWRNLNEAAARHAITTTPRVDYLEGLLCVCVCVCVCVCGGGQGETVV